MSTDYTPSPSLEQLLQRGDIWRGQRQQVVPKPAVDTGYPALNQALIHQGWPLSSLVEICQPSAGHGDWLLIAPLAQSLLAKQTRKHIVLLNPPALPFSQGMGFAGIPCEQLLIVQITTKNDFIASFVELARASCCCLLLAWQPKQGLSYAEMRKCQLACTDGQGVYLLFRHSRQHQQNSPALLRLSLSMSQHSLTVNSVKQRGQLRPHQPPIELQLPDYLLPQKPHRQLGDNILSPAAVNDQVFTRYQPRRNVLALRVGSNRPLKVKHHIG